MDPYSLLLLSFNIFRSDEIIQNDRENHLKFRGTSTGYKTNP